MPKPRPMPAKKYPETIVGIKTAHFEAPVWTAVDRAREGRQPGGHTRDG